MKHFDLFFYLYVENRITVSANINADMTKKSTTI